VVVVVVGAPVGCGGSSAGVVAQPANARLEVSSSVVMILQFTAAVSLVNRYQTASREANQQSVSFRDPDLTVRMWRHPTA
jgi:hypothetical protein